VKGRELVREPKFGRVSSQDAPPVTESARESQTPGSAARALLAFKRGELLHAASELARCEIDDDREVQLQLARRIEQIAGTVRDFGQALVRQELASPFSPAARLGAALLGRIEGTAQRIEQSLERDEGPEMLPADRLAPPEPCATPEEVEHYLAARTPAPQGLIQAPFGRRPAVKLQLVERNHDGYDIWWSGCFFAVRQGRNPRLVLQLVHLQNAWTRLLGTKSQGRERGIRLVVRRCSPAWLLSYLRRRLGGSLAGMRSDPSTARLPLFGIRTARTGLELHHMLRTRRRSKRHRG
jgi:hypothetical protein